MAPREIQLTLSMDPAVDDKVLGTACLSEGVLQTLGSLCLLCECAFRTQEAWARLARRQIQTPLCASEPRVLGTLT